MILTSTLLIQDHLACLQLLISPCRGEGTYVVLCDDLLGWRLAIEGCWVPDVVVLWLLMDYIVKSVRLIAHDSVSVGHF